MHIDTIKLNGESNLNDFTKELLCKVKRCKMTSDIIEIHSFNVQNLTNPKYNVKSETIKYFDREHIHLILERIENQNHKMLFTFMWFTGVRITEALSIRKKDLNFQDFIINIKWLKNRRWENRFIPMHPNLKALMQLYTAPNNTEDLIFNMTRQRAWQLMQKYFDSHPHILRHSFAVNWLKCGGEIVTLSRMLGHSDVKITMQYLQIVPQDQGKELLKITF